MSQFPYLANATLDDGEEVVVDLEQRGWADKEILARTVRWSLVPKTEPSYITLKGYVYPLVQISIPEGAKPIFRSRMFVGNIMSRSSDQIERKVIPHLQVPAFRAFCIGWKKGKTIIWAWVLPTGDIEVGTGDDSHLGEVLRAHLNTQIYEVSEPDQSESDNHKSPVVISNT